MMVIAINNSKKGGMDRNGNIMHVEYVEYWWWQYNVTGVITILACYNGNVKLQYICYDV
jgi:hypothetical protein